MRICRMVLPSYPSDVADNAFRRHGRRLGIQGCARPHRHPIRNGDNDQRQAPRLIADALKAWAQETLPQAIHGIRARRRFPPLLARWLVLARCFDDGRLALDNNPAERALRGVLAPIEDRAPGHGCPGADSRAAHLQ
jgi:hypothetical protein